MSSQTICSCEKDRAQAAPWADAHCHVVITGASRGFGRALCMELLKAMTQGADQAASIRLLLMARDLNALRQTKDQTLLSKATDSQTKVEILIAEPPLDMTNATDKLISSALTPLLDTAPSNERVSHKQWNLLIHNAGTLGNLSLRADQKDSIDELDTYYRANLMAPIILTSCFLRHFAPFDQPHSPVTVLNGSSLAAVQPFPHMSDYCVGKAARHMYLRSLAIDRPTVAVFNYSPGPLDTDMFIELSERHGHEPSRLMAEQKRQSGKLVAPEESARVCVSWLRRRRVIRETSKESPELATPIALACPVHQADYLDIWSGPRLDYYDAVAMECDIRASGELP